MKKFPYLSSVRFIVQHTRLSKIFPLLLLALLLLRVAFTQIQYFWDWKENFVWYEKEKFCVLFFYFSKNVHRIRRRAWIERLQRVCSHPHPPKYAFLEGIFLFAFPIYPSTARRRIKSKSNDISLVCDVCTVRSLYSQLYNFPIRLFPYPSV